MLMLEEAGYQVVKPGSQVNYIPDGKGGRRPVVSQMDLFGAFDLIAIREDRPTRFVQVCNKASGDIAERKGKIEKVKLPTSDVALLCAWHGGRKVLDRRFRKESRYKLFQYFNIYARIHTRIDDPTYCNTEGVKLTEGWYWHGPKQVFPKVQLKNRCWACNRTLRNASPRCPDHPWANNRRMIL
jgi:hypothetical protein